MNTSIVVIMIPPPLLQLKSKAMIDMTIYTLKQFRLLIQCCPKEDEPHSMTFVASERSSPFGTSTSQDEIIVNLCSTLEASEWFPFYCPFTIFFLRKFTYVTLSFLFRRVLSSILRWILRRMKLCLSSRLCSFLMV